MDTVNKNAPLAGEALSKSIKARSIIQHHPDPITQLLINLERVRQISPNKWVASCPTSFHQHGDRSRGLSIKQTTDGKILLHCHAGCRVEDVVSVLGLSMSDLYPPREGKSLRAYGAMPNPFDRDHLKVIKEELFYVIVVIASISAGETPSENDLDRAALAGRRLLVIWDAIT